MEKDYERVYRIIGEKCEEIYGKENLQKFMNRIEVKDFKGLVNFLDKDFKEDIVKLNNNLISGFSGGLAMKTSFRISKYLPKIKFKELKDLL